MRNTLLVIMALVFNAFFLTGCDKDSNPLADYEGERPLTILTVTQNFTPDIQWVGGRVAAVGVNRGSKAALDSTLVWLITDVDNNIESYVTIGPNADKNAVMQYGGTPVDSLSDATEYTFWLAEKSALDGGLQPAALNGTNYTDTTFTTRLILSGLNRGVAGVNITITRRQSLLDDKFTVDWTPRDVPFRRIAIRKGAALPGFQDLVWHAVLEDDAPDSIYPPIEIGVAPSGAQTVVEWPETGFELDTYTFWMATSSWDGTFGLRAPGLGMFTIFATNFE